VESSNKLRAYIYNDLLETFEPIHAPPGGKGISINYEQKTASFDTQVLGIFVIGKENN
jgi:hypothetical protein